MGVPRLFKWLCDRYPHAIEDFFTKMLTSPVRKVDNLYIDANAIIHYCTQRVFNYGSNRRLLDPYKQMSIEQKTLIVFDLFFSKIMELLTIVKPQKLLYIAIDGCAPAGKMAQQRQRRFMSVVNNESFTNFDSNCISPGTEFMDELRKFMNFKILESFEKYPNLQSLKVLFSSSDVPGEGEHKLMEYVRSKYPDSRNESHCMFGPDGDLIMLTLASQCDKFFLLRHDQYDDRKMHIIDIGEVKKGILKDMGFRPGSYSPKMKNVIINDFILMGFFVGNDFLPKIQMFYMLEEGIDLMMKIYWKVTQGKTRMTRMDGNINFPVFSRFVDELQLREVSFLKDQLYIIVNDPKFENKTLMECATSIKNGGNVDYIFDFEKYRIKYNSKISKTSNTHSTEKVVLDYLEGLDWVYKYYTKGCPSYRWMYNHFYSPLMTDFKKHLVSTFQAKYEKTEPHYQFQQLLAILPPKSKTLLPKELQNLLTDKNSPIIDFYPKKFHIDFEGKYQNYQGIAILPLIDYEILEKVYSSIDIAKTMRNRRGNILAFTYETNKQHYKTKFGEINTCAKMRKFV